MNNVYTKDSTVRQRYYNIDCDQDSPLTLGDLRKFVAAMKDFDDTVKLNVSGYKETYTDGPKYVAEENLSISYSHTDVIK